MTVDTARPHGVPLTGLQKAAVLLAQIEPIAAAKMLRHLEESEVVALAEEVARLPLLQAEAVRAVVEEFQLHGQVLVEVKQGGSEAAHRLLVERLGPSAAEEVMARLTAAGAPRPFDFVRGVEPTVLTGYLTDEHPQTVALVLAHLHADLAARVLGQFEPEVRADVAGRIAGMGRLAPEVVAAVAGVLERKLAVLLGAESTESGGVPALVKILNSSDRSAEKQILSELEERDPALAEEVRSQLFVFDDVVRLDDRALQMSLRSIATKDLALALKGASEEIRQAFLRNLSERARGDVVDELELLGPTRLSKVEAAQAEIMRRIRELDASGEIVLIRGDHELLV